MDSLSVVIPTYQRGEILLYTIDQLLSQDRRADEIVIVDQTVYPAGDSCALRLKTLAAENSINWMQLDKPSIPHAMNTGLLAATSNAVLFLDDDVRIDADFVSSHLEALTQHACPAQVGCVLQPGEQQISRSPKYSPNKGLLIDLEFPFNSLEPAFIENCTRLVERDRLIRDTLITYRGSNDIIQTQEQYLYIPI